MIREDTDRKKQDSNFIQIIHSLLSNDISFFTCSLHRGIAQRLRSGFRAATKFVTRKKIET